MVAIVGFDETMLVLMVMVLFFLVCFSVTVIKVSNQKQLGEDGFISSYTSRSPSIIEGVQSRISRQEHRAETIKKHCLLVCSQVHT